MPTRFASCFPWALIQALSASRMRAPARRTSIVSGTSHNPSRKPRTAVSAATRPPLALPIPSAMAAATSRRSAASREPSTAPAKSSLRGRGPVAELKPMLARGVAGSSLIRLASKPKVHPIPGWAMPGRAGRRARVSRRQPAMIVKEVAAGAGRHDDGQIARPTVERVVAAILGIVPGDFGITDMGRIGIHGRPVIVDVDLPGRAAGRIAAGDHRRERPGLPVDGSRRNICRQGGDRRCQVPGQKHDHICLPCAPVASFQDVAKHVVRIRGRSDWQHATPAVAWGTAYVLPKPVEPEPKGKTSPSAVRASLDVPPIHIRLLHYPRKLRTLWVQAITAHRASHRHVSTATDFYAVSAKRHAIGDYIMLGRSRA